MEMNEENKESLLKTIENIEYYTIPACFIFGLISNLTGSLCLLFKSKLRQQSSLFMLSIIGLIDCLFLLTQLQRWLAIYFNDQIFINNHTFCKLYFWLIKFSMLF